MTILLSTNRHQPVALAFLGAAVISSILALVLVPLMGVSGAALAVLVGDICIPAWLVPLLVCREIGDRLSHFGAATGAALIWGIGIPVVVVFVAWHLFPSPVFRYLFLIPISVATALALMWQQLVPFERRLVVHMYQQVLVR